MPILTGEDYIRSLRGRGLAQGSLKRASPITGARGVVGGGAARARPAP